MRVSARTVLLTGVKLTLMVGLLALVLRQVQWHDVETVNAVGDRVLTPGLGSALLDLDLKLYGLAVASMASAVIMSALRWHQVLSLLGLPFRRLEVVNLVFIGDFFNNFLLGSLGGDAVKVFLAVRNRSRKTIVLTSIFVDRLIGLIGLSLHAAVMVLLLSSRGTIDPHSLRLAATPIALVVAGLGGGAILLFSPWVQQALGLARMADRIPMGMGKHLGQAGATIRQLFAAPKALLPVFLATLGCQLFSITAVALMGAALDLDLSWVEFFLAVPIIFIIAAVPVTPGGIGVLEELCLIYLAAAANPNKVLLLALLIRLTMLVCGLPGLIAFWRYGHPKVAQMREELGREEEG